MGDIEQLLKELHTLPIERFPLWQLTAWDKKFNGVDKYMQEKVVKYHYFLAKDLDTIVRDKGDIRILYTTLDEAYTTNELAGDSISEGEVVAIPWGGNPCVKYYNGRFVTGDNRIATSLDPDILDNKYLYYWMLSQLDTIKGFYRGAGIQHPSMKSVLCMEIPLPPLSVQHEVVRILDAFSNLLSNLQQELQIRKKQYNAFRDELFHSICCERCKMSDIASFRYGYTDKAKEKGDCRYIRITDISSDGKLLERDEKYIDLVDENRDYLLKIGDILMARTGATFGKTMLYNSHNQAIFASFLIAITFDKRHRVLPEYYWHFAQSTDYWSQANKLVSGGAQPQFNTGAIGCVTIPVPDINEQHRIISALKPIDELVSNIVTEITLRQKQFEYYREQLLTF